MTRVTIRIITKSGDMPHFTCRNFFHSTELFQIIEKTPGQRPYMLIAEDGEGRVVAHLLASIRRRGSLFPPYFFTQGRIYGEGEYTDEVDKEAVFAEFLAQITHLFKRKLCLFVEFSDISQKMFGYRQFRDNHYFPVHWQEIHNSLHSLPPVERLPEKTRRKIEKANKCGLVTREIANDEELKAFYKLLNGFYRMRMRRIIPRIEQFKELYKSHNARIFITLYKNKLVGGCACAYSEGDAYLWYLASKRKSYPTLHSDTMTVWKAICHAYEHRYAHIRFLDVGLPFKGNPFRDFILSFGGKPVAKYRWFRISIPWLNRLLSWWYAE